MWREHLAVQEFGKMTMTCEWDLIGKGLWIFEHFFPPPSQVEDTFHGLPFHPDVWQSKNSWCSGYSTQSVMYISLAFETQVSYWPLTKGWHLSVCANWRTSQEGFCFNNKKWKVKGMFSVGYAAADPEEAPKQREVCPAFPYRAGLDRLRVITPCCFCCYSYLRFYVFIRHVLVVLWHLGNHKNWHEQLLGFLWNAFPLPSFRILGKICTWEFKTSQIFPFSIDDQELWHSC